MKNVRFVCSTLFKMKQSAYVATHYFDIGVKILSEPRKTITVVVAVSTHVGEGRFHVCSDRLYSLRQRFSNFFQVGTIFISQNVLRTTLLLNVLSIC